ncbi:response regulator [Aliigemmobacter aestuarii]|uniref:histidine kinase n=1 Tax=Aliigemmobacter aestuarii TaxID=1445661 RepID=A0A4S3MM33_9RHOB|nr:PAS-domain containing protein [Gemmobacter aestuarii]THD83187.1 response regulator [Gemmobacter aestuarii]
MSHALINPADPPDRQREKLLQIVEVLMRRVEQGTDDGGAAYTQFQRAALLEDEVRERTRDLEHALDLLNTSNARLAEANRDLEAARQNLSDAIETVQEGFALFDAGDVLVMHNSRFGMHMQDVRAALRPGLSFADYVGLVSRSRFLELPPGETAADWAIRRLRRHKDRHVIFNVRMIWDRWVQVSEHRTPNGGTVILQTDVTDIIRNEREERGRLLDDQARLARATLEHLDQGICIFDAAGQLIGWNRRLGLLLEIPLFRFRIGLDFGALLERAAETLTFADGMTVDRLDGWARRAEGAATREPLRFEVRTEAGLVLSVFAEGMPGGGFVMSFSDVTTERAAIAALSRANETLEARVTERTLELEDALAHAERANASRSRFVAAASHDLLQPLSAAKLFIAAVGEDAIDPRARDTLLKAQNALDSVESILGALLDISKLESGKAALAVGPVDLDRMLTPLRDEFTALAAARGLRLVVRPTGGAIVESDAAYLRRILQNLIANAVRYTDRGGVVVGARRRGGALRIEVWDSGPGIAEADQQDIFREFHRLNARASASEGMGLGLTIVERACGLLGHPLDLSSVPGRGTCFRVTVPLAGTRRAPAPSVPQTDGAGQGLAGRIVLLVENDPDLRRALGLVLEGWGAEVIEADTADAADALLSELGILPDAVIADQQLGDGPRGLDFAAGLTGVPALIISADRGEGLAVACARAGVGLMAKPLDLRALRDWLVLAFGPGGIAG